jgi:dephospho-CoA kinase
VTTVGLTGSIGSGKSTFAHLLGQRGAAVLDADDVARELQRPGERLHEATVARFGPEVVGPGGDLDRAALARIVFADPSALAELEALTHPAVHDVMAERAAAAASSAQAVVLVVPLLLEVAHYEVAGVIVVDCPVETVVQRLADGRGMAEAEVRARLARQLSREERLARADLVIDNSGLPEALPPQADRAWSWILDGAARSDVPPPR